MTFNYSSMHRHSQDFSLGCIFSSKIYILLVIVPDYTG